MRNLLGGRSDGSKSQFGGDLSAFSLFELCQFLMVMRRSGTVAVRSGKRNATVAVREGQIVSVVDDALQQGEEAFYRIACWSEGTFEFTPGTVNGTGLGVSTDGLLLEAARRLDEGELVAEGNGDAGGNRVQALLDGQHLVEEFAALRRSLDDGGGEEIDYRKDVPLAALVEAARRRGASEILLSPDRPARCRTADGVVELQPAPVPERALERLRQELRGSLAVRTAGAEWAAERALSGGRVVRARGGHDAGAEFLHLRILETTPPELDAFGAEAESFVPALLSSGASLFLVGAVHAEGRSSFCARLALELAESGRSVLWAAERRDFALAPRRGWVETLDLLRLGSRRAAARVREMRPGAVVFDPARGSLAVRAALEAVAGGAVAVVALEAEDLEETVRHFAGYLSQAPSHSRATAAGYLHAALHVEKAGAGDDSPWTSRGGALSTETVARLLGQSDIERRAA